MNFNLENITPLGKSKKRKFGAVFLMVDSDTKKQYILKTANKGQISERALQQLKNEYTFSFTHPGLPKVISFDETNETITLLLEYKKGIALADYWETIAKKQRLDFTKQLVAKTGALLDEIHAHQIYHCDIKPSNILIEKTETDFNVYLIDFGMTVDKKEPDCLNRELIFPLGFAAPELILNRIDLINKTTDYFALGITIYRLWTGKLPLAHINPSIFTNLQLAHPIPSDSSIPKQLNEWIQKVCYKPLWKTAPNLMSEQESSQTLFDSFEKRYRNSQELIEGIEKVQKRNWFW
jgi:serine/threonine protein kinase